MKMFVIIVLVSFSVSLGSSNNSSGPNEPIVCDRPHEHYECGSACQTTCENLGKPCPIVNIRCNDACYCDEGYARNKEGCCIHVKQCPA